MNAPPPTPVPNRVRIGLSLVIIALVAGYIIYQRFTPGAGPFSPEPLYTATTEVMGGIRAQIIIVRDRSAKVSAEEAAERAFAAIREVDERMSDYKANSDIGRLNAAKAGEMIKVDPRTWQVLMSALRYHRLSAGAFDITVRPVLQLYKYDQESPPALPPEALVRETLKRVGSDKIRFEREEMRVGFTVPGMAVDLGAIAKGFAVDQAVRTLKRLGVRNALVEVGGEYWTMGKVPEDSAGGSAVTAPRPNARQSIGQTEPGAAAPEGADESATAGKRRSWRIGIRHPRGTDPYDLIEKINRTDCAIATSGDYAKFFVLDGKRYSHIIDPRTGYPMQGGIVSATIVSPRSCMEADALATAVSVMGVAEARKFLRGFPGVEAILCILEGGALRPDLIHIKIPRDLTPPAGVAAAGAKP